MGLVWVQNVFLGLAESVCTSRSRYKTLPFHVCHDVPVTLSFRLLFSLLQSVEPARRAKQTSKYLLAFFSWTSHV